MAHIFHIFLALLGLNLLIFIHELGHYIMARREGMRVEVFSIGFGKPLVSWMRKGAKWQICPIFFGGYVRIAEIGGEKRLEPHEVPGGFYSKKPIAQIRVALAGPLANLILAFVFFGVIWGLGGREKPFAQFTRLIGYMDPNSELYQNGVRPGDEITEYNGKFFSGYKDLIYAAIMNGRPANVEGNKVDYFSSHETPYDYTLNPYESLQLRKGLKTIGVLAPAMYLIYNKPLYPDSPLEHSGIQLHDRIVAVNGELIFSNEQLMHILNNDKVLLTIKRNEEVLLGKVSRVPLTDLRLTSEESLEFHDWKYEAGLHNQEKAPLFIPYSLSHDLRIQNGLFYVNDDSKVTRAPFFKKTSPLDTILQPGDLILAVDGIPVHNGVSFLREIQTPRAQIVVKRGGSKEKISWKEEDGLFKSGTNWPALLPIMQSIGTANPIHSNEDFHLLRSVTPIPLKDFPFTKSHRAEFDKQIKNQLQEAEKILDPEEKEVALDQITKAQNRLMLGASLQDRTVIYNPNALTLFSTVFQEVARNLFGLFSGYLSPKQFGGPLFIVQVMQQSWGVNIKEALFWLGAISLNLGVLNLLPIPVLDGGHICFSLLEAVRKKPLKAKTMQRLVFPFIGILIFFFIYLIYHDFVRIFGRLF